MDTSSFRSESHVAQQSRRDKLRIQASSSLHHLDDFSNNLEHLSVHSGLNPDLVQLRDVRNGGNVIYDPINGVFPSPEILNFASGSNVFPARDHHHHHALLTAQEPGRPITGDSLFINMSHQSHQISSNFNSPPKANTNDPQGCSNWRNIDSHQSYDWMVNYNTGGLSSSSSVGRENNQKPMFVGDVLSNNARVSNISTTSTTSYNGYQDVHQFSLANPSGEIPGQVSSKQFGDNNMQIATSHIHPSLYQRNAIQDVGNQSTAALYFDNSANAWMNRPVENCHQWSGELGLRRRDQELRLVSSDHNNTQGLSLSLSSNPPTRGNVTQFGEGYESEYLHSKSGILKGHHHQDSKLMKSTYLSPMSKQAIISRTSGKFDEMAGTSNHALRNAGPLGPFTGYATILKSSRFLKPAQELLDEFCDAIGLKVMRTGGGCVKISTEVNSLASADVLNAVADGETDFKGNNDNSGVSSSTFYSSNELSGDVGVASSSGESYRPEYQQRKAKLLFLQDEVCRRYKQYHQQMQMVASSFDSVAGLSAATPYVSVALKTVSRNFRCLKIAISDQLKQVTKALGEDLMPSNAGASSSKADGSLSRMRYMDQSFDRYKPGGANVGLYEPQQHVWRPQRGLPERSVAILRAWLFEHFLHPYPTDTDKHMLATQTGLSRNQVSNWFINARVRVWKPMVEEIHMLETKGLAESNRSTSNNDGKSKESRGTNQPNDEQTMNNVGPSSILNKQMECSGSGSSAGSGEQQQMNTEHWNQDKRSRLDQFQVPPRIDGSMMNFLPYQRNGIDIGAGLGAVSLTLGLRHGVENVQQQHPQLQRQEEDQLRRHFGGQMIHDFVG